MQYYISDQRAREDAGCRGRAFVENRHTEEQGLARWDEVLHAALDNDLPGPNAPRPVSTLAMV
jgi:hypothetical protein